MSAFIDAARLSEDLDEAIAAGNPVRVAVVGNPAHSRGTCDRCGGRARYAGLGGSWCCGCWSTRKCALTPIVEGAAALLATRYGIQSWEQFVDSLADESGHVRIRASSAPVGRLHYHPDPAATVEAILAGESPYQRLGLQLNILARCWFGLALRWGVQLQGFPRSGYPAPDEIPHGLVAWVEGDLRAYRWLVSASLRARAAYHRRYRHDHAAAEQIGWLLPRCADLSRFLRCQPGHLPAPLNVHLERSSCRSAA